MQFLLSGTELINSEKFMLVPKTLLCDVHFALISLKQYIDQAPPDNPLLWIADRKTPVITLPDYHYAEEAIEKLNELKL
jgi:hypothetical protein